MAKRSAATGATGDVPARLAECQCPELFNAKEPERERCLIVCGNLIHEKWVQCRPCAKGNHTGQPCRQFDPEPVFMHMKTCAECGYESHLHNRGSDGRPFSEAV